MTEAANVSAHRLDWISSAHHLFHVVTALCYVRFSRNSSQTKRLTQELKRLNAVEAQHLWIHVVAEDQHAQAAETIEFEITHENPDGPFMRDERPVFVRVIQHNSSPDYSNRTRKWWTLRKMLREINTVNVQYPGHPIKANAVACSAALPGDFVTMDLDRFLRALDRI